MVYAGYHAKGNVYAQALDLVFYLGISYESSQPLVILLRNTHLLFSASIISATIPI